MLRVAGAGLGLPVGQAIYPTNELPNIPYGTNGNRVSLAPGQSFQIPAGDFFIDLGKYSILEFQDPTETGTWSQSAAVWKPLRTTRWSGYFRSDGQNYRISNLLGCAVSAYVQQKGSSYTQSSTTVTASTGNSTWSAVVGGGLSALTSIAVGAGYGLPPIVYIPPPPGPGVQASAVVSTLTNGVVKGFTIINEGAGYTAAPTVTLLPNPYDPNIYNNTAITTATAKFKTVSSGDIRAIFCTNPGAAVANTMTLSITSTLGSGAVATPNFLETVSKLSVVTAGTGAAANAITNAGMTTIGGIPTANTASVVTETFLPRPLQATFAITGNMKIGAATIIDGGMFLMTGTAKPEGFLMSYPAAVFTTNPSITVKLGSANDTIIVQPM
jgi:hypothetical protein